MLCLTHQTTSNFANDSQTRGSISVNTVSEQLFQKYSVSAEVLIEIGKLLILA